MERFQCSFFQLAHFKRWATIEDRTQQRSSGNLGVQGLEGARVFCKSYKRGEVGNDMGGGVAPLRFCNTTDTSNTTDTIMVPPTFFGCAATPAGLFAAPQALPVCGSGEGREGMGRGCEHGNEAPAVAGEARVLETGLFTRSQGTL